MPSGPGAAPDGLPLVHRQGGGSPARVSGSRSASSALLTIPLRGDVRAERVLRSRAGIAACYRLPEDVAVVGVERPSIEPEQAPPTTVWNGRRCPTQDT